MKAEAANADRRHRRQGPMTFRELAVGIGATVALFMTVVFLPVTGIFASVLTPVPPLISLYLWGRPLGLLVPGGAALIGSAALAAMGSWQTLAYFMELLVLGTLLGLGMRHHRSLTRIVGEASIKVFLLGAVLFWWTHSGPENGMWMHLEKRLSALMTALVQDSGLNEVQQAMVRDGLSRLVPLLVRVFPGIALGSTIVFGWLNLYVASRFLSSRNHPLPAWIPWRFWSTPDVLVWVVIGAGFLTLMPVPFAKILGLNLLFASASVYLLHGLAIVAFFMARWNVPGLFRGVIYGLIFLQQFLSLAVAVAGLFDTWFDFRRLNARPASPAGRPPL